MTDIRTMLAPTGQEINGTFETVLGCAAVSFHAAPATSYEHAGGTKMFWDTSETKTIDGVPAFIDNDGTDWLAHHLIEEDAEPLPDDVIALFKAEMKIGEALLHAIALANAMRRVPRDPEVSGETHAWAFLVSTRLRSMYLVAKKASLAAMAHLLEGGSDND